MDEHDIELVMETVKESRDVVTRSGKKLYKEQNTVTYFYGPLSTAEAIEFRLIFGEHIVHDTRYEDRKEKARQQALIDKDINATA
jgi:hypothetical protein